MKQYSAREQELRRKMAEFKLGIKAMEEYILKLDLRNDGNVIRYTGPGLPMCTTLGMYRGKSNVIKVDEGTSADICGR